MVIPACRFLNLLLPFLLNRYNLLLPSFLASDEFSKFRSFKRLLVLFNLVVYFLLVLHIFDQQRLVLIDLSQLELLQNFRIPRDDPLCFALIWTELSLFLSKELYLRFVSSTFYLRTYAWISIFVRLPFSLNNFHQLHLDFLLHILVRYL
jgi:hypothetical protein